MYGSASTSTCARSAVSIVMSCTPHSHPTKSAISRGPRACSDGSSRLSSRRVLRVDTHVLGREVAAPGLRGAGTEAKLGFDFDLGLLKGRPHALQVDGHPGASREDLEPADRQPEAVDRQLGAAVA